MTDDAKKEPVDERERPGRKVPSERDLLASLETPAEESKPSSSMSGKLEAMLRVMAEEHRWDAIEEKVVETIERVPQVAETALSSWLWWLIVTTATGVIVMGWLRVSDMAGWRQGALQAVLPVLGNSLLMVSALALIWAGRSGVKAAGEDTEFGSPTLRWLIIGAGWAAALMGILMALLPAATAGRVPGDFVPFIIILAVSGLVGSWALELRHQEEVLTVAPRGVLRSVSVIVGVLLIVLGSLLQVYFLIFPR